MLYARLTQSNSISRANCEPSVASIIISQLNILLMLILEVYQTVQEILIHFSSLTHSVLGSSQFVCLAAGGWGNVEIRKQMSRDVGPPY